jgi:hypothetical protein
MKTIGFGLLVLGVLLTPSLLTHASEVGLQDGDIDVTTIPENPEPYGDVTIKISSYATDLNKAFIEWHNGSKILLSGYGKLSYSFQAPGPDLTTDFYITITPPDSADKFTKKVTIKTSEVELMWESIGSYTPPFYRGKSFPSRESTIKVVAIPNTNIITKGKGNITYAWQNDDNAVQSASGYGKDYYIFSNDQLKTKENISVQASSIDGKYNATKTIDIPIVNPKIIFYKKSPTEGVLYNNALTDGTLISEDEVTLVAEPYFLALDGNEVNFSYNWKINGETIDTPSKKTELTVRPAERGGYATIDLVMENLNFLFQKVAGKLNLTL